MIDYDGFNAWQEEIEQTDYYNHEEYCPNCDKKGLSNAFHIPSHCPLVKKKRELKSKIKPLDLAMQRVGIKMGLIDFNDI